MTDFARRIERLSPPKRALLAQHLAASGASGSGDAREERRLVAYVVPDGSIALDGSELRAYLKQRVPDYMVPASVVLLDALPRTPNGKLDLNALTDTDAIEPLMGTFVAPRTEMEATVTSIWEAVLGFSPIGIHDNFFEIGGDSILSIQIVARLRQAGLQVSPAQLFEHQTIADLAAAVSVGVPRTLVPASGIGQVALTPIQHWFFEQEFAEAHHWHQSLWLTAPETMTVERLQRAVQLLAERHDALRLRFDRTPDGWQQRLVSPESCRPVVTGHDLSGLDADARDARLVSIAAETDASMRLDAPPLMRAALFDMGDGEQRRLLLSVHHLIVDPLSWPVLLEDLSVVYRQLERGESVALSAPTTSFQQWSDALQAFAASPAPRAETDYWLADIGGDLPRLPVDYAEGKFSEATAQTHVLRLESDETTALMHEVHAAYNTGIEDLLLAALVRAVALWTGEGALRVGLERHGREELQEDLDLSRTVGWFTTFFPVRLRVDPEDDPAASIKAVKEQLRSIPGRGLGYGVLRYLHEDSSVRDRLRAMQQPEIVFNYTGRADRPSDQATPLEPMGLISASRGGENRRRHLLEVNAFVMDERLTMYWSFSRAVHRPDTIARLAADYGAELRTLIAHCRSAEAGGVTPSDFPDAGLSEEALDKLLRNLR